MRDKNIYQILESLDAAQRGVKQLPALFRPKDTSPQLSGPYPGRNATQGYLVGEQEVPPTVNRGGHNKLRDRKDYLDKRDILFRQLTPGIDAATRMAIKDRLAQLEKAAELAGLKEGDETGWGSETGDSGADETPDGVSPDTQSFLDEEEQDNPMARAVIRRIVNQHPEWIVKYGVEFLMQVIDDVTEGDDWEEIGSSDVSAYVNMVHDQLRSRGGSREEMDEGNYVDPNRHPQTRDYGRGEEDNKDQDDVPFKPDTKPSDRDQFGNVIKHRARHLARQGMRKAQVKQGVGEDRDLGEQRYKFQRIKFRGTDHDIGEERYVFVIDGNPEVFNFASDEDSPNPDSPSFEEILARVQRSGAVKQFGVTPAEQQAIAKKIAAERQRYLDQRQQGVSEGFLGDREYNRVMPVVKRIASEVSDYDRDEFGEELWSLLNQKYGSKFAQSVLQDSLSFYWDEYTIEVADQQGVSESKNTTEDVISTVKKKLGDYLSDLSKEIKSDPDLKDKLERDIDQIGPAVKTLKTDDGHEIKIHGNEDDGFRITIKNKQAKTRFRDLDEATMAVEMYCARRRGAAMEKDYLEER